MTEDPFSRGAVLALVGRVICSLLIFDVNGDARMHDCFVLSFGLRVSRLPPPFENLPADPTPSRHYPCRFDILEMQDVVQRELLVIM